MLTQLPILAVAGFDVVVMSRPYFAVFDCSLRSQRFAL